jgi:hypothetical protein
MSNVYHYRLKLYPDGRSEYVEFKEAKTVLEQRTFTKPAQTQEYAQLQLTDAQYMPFKVEDLRDLQKLARRKSKVRDYVLSGNFDYFGTLTFTAETAHDDLDDVFRQKMIHFTRMLRRRHVAYYIVAEKHTGGGKNHGKIHLHGLFSENLEIVPSPASKKYFKIPLWLHGFSSVEKIRDQTATAHYVTKYVTKEALSGKSVWVSQGLARPEVLYNVPDVLTPIISEWYGSNVNITLRGN